MKTCDNASVGVLITDDQGRLLVFQRNTAPVGIAPPAGHVFDDHEVLDAAGNRDEGASYRAAAVAEVAEEVGLTVTGLELVTSGWRKNRCRRAPGPHGAGHDWRIYRATVTGDLTPSARETQAVRWADRQELQALASRTLDYVWGSITDEEFAASPGIEPVWVQWLTEAGFITDRGTGDLEEIDRFLCYRAERGVTKGVTVTVEFLAEGSAEPQTLWAEVEDWEHVSRLQEFTRQAREHGTGDVIALSARLTRDGTDYPRTLRAARTTITEVEPEEPQLNHAPMNRHERRTA